MKYLSLTVALLLTTLSAAPAYAARPHFVGVNLSGAEFAPQKLPGRNGFDYIWPTPADIDSYADLGSNMIRVPFLWERMQPILNMPLDQQELAHLDAIVAEGAKRGVTILLDVHNYGSYKGQLIGSQNLPANDLADLWSRLATHYKSMSNVAFGLMNEPNKQTPTQWAAIAQQTINAIRKTGAKQLILVPGTAWTGAHSWIKSGNAAALASIKDPGNNFIFEAHQYFDADSSGTHSDCVGKNVVADRLTAMTDWLRKTRHKALLGEFGVTKDPACVDVLKQTLAYMADNSDVWYGWTYWVAGPWFGNYPFNVYPPDPKKYPQIEVLKQAMSAQ